MMLRLCRASLAKQARTGAGHPRRCCSRRSAPGAAATPTHSSTRRGFAADADGSNNATPTAAAAAANREEGGGGGEDEEEQAVDEAAARRAALLKRYGDRTPPSGPIAVKPKKPSEAGGFDVEKAAAGEVNHNEIWGDYVRYMEHQRKKGWKT